MSTGRSAGRLPGVPQLFATAWELDGVGRSLLVSCVDGRPVKVEGNPDDPNGRGSSSAFDQALILNLYDPDRLGGVTRGAGAEPARSSLDAALAALDGALGAGAGRTAVLCEATGSPTLKRLRDRATAAGATWCEYSPLARQGPRPAYDLSAADVILCLGRRSAGRRPRRRRPQPRLGRPPPARRRVDEPAVRDRKASSASPAPPPITVSR